MDRLRGLLDIIFIIGFAIAISKNKKAINWRTLGVGLLLQAVFALVVLRWKPGFNALKGVAGAIEKVIDFTGEGTSLVFGNSFSGTGKNFVFILNVPPVIIFLGAVLGALYHLRVMQYFVEYVGSALKLIMGTSKVKSVFASTVIFPGQSEAPLVVKPYIPKLIKSEPFVCMSGGFASVAESTLVGYSLFGAPLKYLLAASAMNAPGSLLIAKTFWSEIEGSDLDASMKDVRDIESKSVIDALGSGALAGGRIAVVVACLLIASITVIAMLSAMIGGIGGWSGQENQSLGGLLDLISAPIAWLVGVPWENAGLVGSFIGEKMILNEFVDYTSSSEHVDSLDPKSTILATFALVGFANLSSIAVQIGSFDALSPEHRGEIAKSGPLALIAGLYTNLLNATIVGVIALQLFLSSEFGRPLFQILMDFLLVLDGRDSSGWKLDVSLCGQAGA